MTTNIESTQQPKRQFGPAWRKDGGSFGTPTGKQSDKESTTPPISSTTTRTTKPMSWSAAAQAPPAQQWPTQAQLQEQQVKTRREQERRDTRNDRFHHHYHQREPPGGLGRSYEGGRRAYSGGSGSGGGRHHTPLSTGPPPDSPPLLAQSALPEKPLNIARRDPARKYTVNEMLTLRKPTEMLESIRASVPQNIASHEALEPMSSKPRPTAEEIASIWEKSRPRPLEQKDGTIPSTTTTALSGDHGDGGSSRLPPQAAKWERGVRVPENQQRSNKSHTLWDDVEDIDGSNRDGEFASWADQAAAFEREMAAMREASAKGLPLNLPDGHAIGNPDMFGAGLEAPQTTALDDEDNGSLEKFETLKEENENDKDLETFGDLPIDIATKTDELLADGTDNLVLEKSPIPIQSSPILMSSGPPPGVPLPPPGIATDRREKKVELPWYYRDPQGNIQGPFEPMQMRQWFDAGYFDDDLPVRQQTPDGPFLALGIVFSSARTAFVAPPAVDPDDSPAPQKPSAQQQTPLIETTAATNNSNDVTHQQQDPLATLNSLLNSNDETRGPAAAASGATGADTFGYLFGKSVAEPAPDNLLAGWQQGSLNVGRLGALGGALFDPTAAPASADQLGTQQASPVVSQQQQQLEQSQRGGHDMGALSLKEMLGMGQKQQPQQPIDRSLDQQQLYTTQSQQIQHQQNEQEQQPQPSAAQQRREKKKSRAATAAAESHSAQNKQQSDAPQQHSRRQQQRQQRVEQHRLQQTEATVVGSEAQGAAQQPAMQQQQQRGTPPRAPWAGADAKKLSLREIQEQEEAARAAANVERQRQMQINQQHQMQNQQRVTQNQPSSMAARLAAAHGLQGPYQPTSHQQIQQQQQQRLAQAQQAQTQAPVINQRPRAPAPAAMQQPTAQSKKTASPFGAASQNNTLEAWCKTQLKKITGSDDLTLIQFCMTLDDTSEIRQYLSMYLGSTPPVAAFANEFIKRKQNKGGTESTSSLGGGLASVLAAQPNSGKSQPSRPENDDLDFTVSNKSARRRGRRANKAAA
uniref:GYF domain-containing protein n=1 Tax=Aureoumbra lagunensis TaxID=44058 RepID=A0A6S8CDN4_9STRA|mmetsp:Transcript_20849/g.27019  ORF Transcript_20849/g.27019 Transcript_20849/m.27019 type:complete len:1035 (-) Transcript_20849:607-3711(-)|eukprot:CAMPEP_0197284980 /NCGR_PEP_ID=MMETSP0890-20130614/49_1 /TAXON_ID=44058 ORGANISM="Aureoumbra lagunensis, Strain CCMP1510" /NCGR_SAMPLE_ID=MMETSP0890 /ASSEMBLY_ACC=CAM_ASM_000533 /LENGTH=1034 /DNA_ID=CAMNT_0042752023 /DNA_START=213 /DNA_END=3317 /DNA_ORIENTATION=-